jgi:(p)ppGpp synthase/HD superfamily hydrolase
MPTSKPKRPKPASEPRLSDRFVRAFREAARLHARQTRKGKQVPYISHLMGVASLVLEAGGDEDMAVAALLHDAIEDQGGAAARARIRRAFGPRVAEIVEGCTDADTPDKGPWLPRKKKYIERLRSARPEVLIVSAADKIHNLRETLADYHEQGEKVFQRFSKGKRGTLWYYRALLAVFDERLRSDLGSRKPGMRRLVEELARMVHEMDNLAAKRGAN